MEAREGRGQGPLEVLASNTRGLRPSDRPALQRAAREAAGVPVDVRVSPRLVEFVFHGAPRPGSLIVAAAHAGPVVDALEGEHPPVGGRGFLALLRAGLYWRAHTAAEAAWRAGGGEPARGLAVLAGALAKAQEGLLEPALRLLGKARAILGGEGFDWDCLRSAVEAAARGGLEDAGRCIDPGVVDSILGAPGLAAAPAPGEGHAGLNPGVEEDR